MKKLLSVVLATALCTWAPAQVRLLVGTYTENTPAEGVYLYSFDTESARTTLLDMAPSGNPSFVIAVSDKAYAVNEFNDGRQAVSAFLLTESSIKSLGSVPIPKAEIDGEDPCNILFTGGAVLTSNYTGGSLSAFPVNADGNLSELSQSYATHLEYTATLSGRYIGTEPAHMHCAVISPDGKYIFATNLGMDCIHRFDRKDGEKPLGKSIIAWKHRGLRKFGPRHLIFSADGRFAYLLSELADKLVVFSYSDGTLTPIQTLTAYKGRGHGSADIHLSPDGRFLYTSHRLKNDGIAIFRVDPSSGKVKRAGYQETGIHPRNFAISPDGRFLLCACRDSNRIEVYSIDSSTGSLSLLEDRSISVGAPVCVQFVL
ncbi:MAG: lactonase family protein [Bacteroidales bacterium]|nr:lactonase family protein [Bacteroidales bacterium]